MPESPTWSCQPCSIAAADRLSRDLGVSGAVAQVLVRRGYADAESARAFLAADERHDPFAFEGIDVACDVILAHASRGSRVVVHGDYDVDGVCSTAILVNALNRLGAVADWHLPSRFDGGYGLSKATVERVAASGAHLLITVDCGITAVDEVEEALRLGLDVVVTDHHRPADRLPPCPIVHPAISGYPCAELCAAGVAHKLVEALYTRAGEDPRRADEDLDLVGLATVADCVPLRGENRRLVRDGMRALAKTERPGLRALMDIASLSPQAVDEQAAGFRLAPRLNAAGRLGRADAALELLLTGDERRAEEVADELDFLNRERRDTETRIMFAAEAARAEAPDAPAYVLAGENWNPGVIGIVASRMVERHHRPCVLIALGEDGGRGSGRSIAPYDLHAGLAACASHLTRFGGHRMAAGFEIEPGNVAAFREAFTRHAAQTLSPEDLRRVERVDAVVSGDAVGFDLAEDLSRLAPFGEGNPAPTVLLPAARVSDVRAMGEERQHSSFTITSGGARARVVAFRTGREALGAAAERPHDVAARLELNEWGGVVEPRLVLRALCPTEAGPLRVLSAGPGSPRADGAPAIREIRDRRTQGIAGVAGELLASGEGVLLVCADVSRRRAGLEQVVGGLARAVGEAGAEPAIVSWEDLRAQPGLAAPYAHVLAIDPPIVPGGEQLLAAAPSHSGPAFAHLAWGVPEVGFSLATVTERLEVRRELGDLYRELRAAAGPVSGQDLERMLSGSGEHPRTALEGERLVRILTELGLARLEDGSLSCVVTAGQARTSLELSASYRAYRQDLEEAARLLEQERLRLGAPAASKPA